MLPSAPHVALLAPWLPVMCFPTLSFSGGHSCKSQLQSLNWGHLQLQACMEVTNQCCIPCNSVTADHCTPIQQEILRFCDCRAPAPVTRAADEHPSSSLPLHQVRLRPVASAPTASQPAVCPLAEPLTWTQAAECIQQP